MTTVDTPPVVDGERVQAQAAQRWFGTGRSADSDARVAGAQAVSAALAGRSASLVIVFCPVSIDLQAMLEGVCAEAGDVPLIGCSGNVLYPNAGPADLAVVVIALGGDGFEVHTSVVANVSSGQRAAGELVAEAVGLVALEHKILLMLSDGIGPEQQDVVRGAYSVVGATVPMVGGCAADDLAFAQTFQFYADAQGVHIVSDAVVAAAIGSNAPVGVGIAHGWRKVGEPMLVTSSDGGHIRTLDGEPALDVFLRRTGAPRSITLDTAAFNDLAMNHPVGLSRRSGEDLRSIFGGDVTDGSLSCMVDVPQGGLLWMMESDQQDLIACVDDAFDEALAPLGDLPALGFLVFDCIARHTVLGSTGIGEELDRLVDRAGSTPLAGFVTYGEVARVRGSWGMHQLTLVILAFA